MSGINVAIILAVSEYQNTSALPGCKNDFRLISELINKVRKYDRILYINQDTQSTSVKEKLKEFIIQNQDTEINELMFYYTGHGTFDGEDLRYILSDYVPEKINSTTITNEFIDNLFRSLNPKLTVKIVDACNSGIPYIKGDSSLPDVFSQKKDLNNCYFMFSSQKDQFSYVDKLSYFTKSFVKAVIEHPTQYMGYSDIIDYIKDVFKDQKQQTPYFITQGSLTENFCEVTDEVRTIKIEDFEILNKIAKREMNLLEVIKKNAESYFTKEELNDLLIKINQNVESLINKFDLKDCFEIELSKLNNYRNVQGIKSVAKWVNENPNDFFVKVEKEEIKNDSGLFNLPLFRSPQYEPSNIHTDLDVPFNTFKINAKPKIPNLQPFTCNIVLLISRHNMMVFYSFVSFKEVGWDIYNEIEIGKWKKFGFEYNEYDQSEKMFDDIFIEFENYIKDALRRKFLDASPKQNS